MVRGTTGQTNCKLGTFSWPPPPPPPPPLNRARTEFMATCKMSKEGRRVENSLSAQLKVRCIYTVFPKVLTKSEWISPNLELLCMCHITLRVGMDVSYLGWFYFYLGVPPSCPTDQLILPNFQYQNQLNPLTTRWHQPHSAKCNTGWPVRLIQTYCWRQNKNSVAE